MKKVQVATLMAGLLLTTLFSRLQAQISIGNGNNQITPNAAVTNMNVGISNTTPQLKLDIKSSYTNDGIRIQQTSNTAASLNLQAASGRRWALFSLGSGNSSTGNFAIYDYGGTAGAGGGYRFFIHGATGNVGIGSGIAVPQARLDVQNGVVRIGNVTTPAGYKLYVETGILTEKIKVALKGSAQWADYVFEKNYRLNSLEEVEAFVHKHKHLPGIPSSAELVQNGLNLGDMQAKQMEKIEELTLYMIELKKQVEWLKNEHARLASVISPVKN